MPHFKIQKEITEQTCPLRIWVPMHMDLLIIAAEVFGVFPFLCLCSFIPRTDHA